MAATAIESNEMSDDFYRAFEARHRGSHELIKNRLKVYLPFVLPLHQFYPESNMIDLGCGRGEWLDLLRDSLVDAIGIDLEDGMLNACYDLGFNTEKIDALDYLAGLPKNSVSVITAFHLVEHVNFEYLRSLVAESMRVLMPGGLLIMETPNPENIMVGTESFYIDPSHVKPIPPALLSFLPEYYGFIRTKVLRLQESESLINTSCLSLSDVLHGVSPDFSVVAQKAGPEQMLNALNDVFGREYGLNLRTISENYDAQIQHKIDFYQNLVLQQANERALQAELRESDARRSLQEALVVIQQENERASQAEIKTNEVSTELSSVYASLSWKLTYVLRWFKLKLMQLKSLFLVFFLKFKTFHTSIPDLENKIGLPKLFFVSPLPPEKTGIAEYSYELIKELTKYFDIELVVTQKTVSKLTSFKSLKIRDIQWFKKCSHKNSLIIYHVGNSKFHSHMLELLREFPGVVVMHDFFIGHMLANQELSGSTPLLLSRSLYDSHGYMAIKKRFQEGGVHQVIEDYPANFNFLRNSRALVFHSDYAQKLLNKFYPASIFKTKVIPHLRKIPTSFDKLLARKKIGFGEQDFIVCAFGVIGPTKLSHKLLESWFHSDMSKNQESILVFVGDNPEPEYANQLQEIIKNSPFKSRVSFTGWVSNEYYNFYLASADFAVQLRGMSRGESSGAVLDCMKYGLPTIVNANGAMAEFPSGSTFMIKDVFTNAELLFALNMLGRNSKLRLEISASAKKYIEEQHSPIKCAFEYAQIINKSFIFPIRQEERRTHKILFLDVTAIALNDLKTGIQRVVRSLVIGMLESPPEGYRIEPVFLSDHGGAWGYWYAREFTSKCIDIPLGVLSDACVSFFSGDVLFVADYAAKNVIEASKAGLYDELRTKSVSVNFLVYDLIPIKRPEFFPQGTNEIHADWLSAISASGNHLICISESVVQDLKKWLAERLTSKQAKTVKVSSVHLGADLESSVPSKGISSDDLHFVKKIKASHTFLMAGTIEPRKGHLQTIAAFEILWKKGVDVNLLIVGKEGWLSMPESSRRTIPKIVEAINQSPELNEKLFWLNDVSDEYLLSIYEASTCLIAASEDEGFGLPLIEAARNNLAIIARDISVFREVAGDHAYYFDSFEPHKLGEAIENWLKLHSNNLQPSSAGLNWISWQDCICEMYRYLNLNNEMQEVS